MTVKQHETAKETLQRSLIDSVRRPEVALWAFGWPLGWYIAVVYFLVVPSLPAGASPSVVGPVMGINAVGFAVYGAFTASAVLATRESTRENGVRRLRDRFLYCTAVSTVAAVTVVLVSELGGATFAGSSAVSVPVAIAGFLAVCAVGVGLGTLVSVPLADDRYSTVAGLAAAVIPFYASGFNGIVADSAVAPLFVETVPPAVATRLIASYTVPVSDWGAAGLSPPAMPTLSGGVTILIVSVSLVGGGAVLVDRSGDGV